MTQFLEMLIIILPLFLALLKLRQFRTKHKKQVRETKLRVHFAIATLLLLLFIVDTILQWRLASIFWIKHQNPLTFQEVQSDLRTCLYWQICL